MSKELKCPNCGSLEVSRPKPSRGAMAMAILLIGFPIPFLKKKSHCFDCEIDFKP
ncbi:hypothetical protein [Mariniflexile sp. HMF6888]|uniref:hypothetical protein n=1 Tax=Mariniflexile sp. HMF6888 TaxID=3373086 RepID=UPI0037B63C76